MNKVVLQLELERVMNGPEREELLIAPLREHLGGLGHVLFSVPELTCVDGKRTFKPVSLEITVYDFTKGLQVITEFLKNREFYNEAQLKFYSNDYNLLTLT